MSCIDLLGRTWATPAGAQASAPPAPPVPSPPSQPASAPLPAPPDVNEPLTVDLAWAIFGIPQKRAPKDVVRRQYLSFAAKWHPDRNPNAVGEATAQLARANAAWALLQKHCRW